MKINNKPNFVLISSFCFIIVLCSKVLSTENLPCIEMKESHKTKYTEIYSDISEDIDNSEKASHPSLCDYVIYPINTAIHKTFQIINFAMHNPQRATILSLCLAYQFTAAIAVDCHCSCIRPYSNQWEYKGVASSLTECNQVCGIGSFKCIPLKKDL